MASTYLTRNEVDPQGNRKTFTLSQWLKKTDLGVEGAIFCHRLNNNYYFHIRFNTDDTLKIQEYVNSSQTLNWQSNRRFRDTNAWYHIVCAFDTTQATDSNRIKVYVNGVQETSIAAVSYPSQNLDLGIDGGAGYASHYGQRGDGAMYLGCVMSHAHYTQGTAYDASAFGQTDATTGEWSIKTSPSVTYGTKGYFILKDGNSVTDQSPNTNNFTVGGGTLTKTEDCPSNVFCVFSPIDIPTNSSGTTRTIHNLSNGNLTLINTNSDYREARSTFYLNKGKWYWEAKSTREGGSQSAVGVVLNSYAAGSGHRRLYQHNAKKYDDGGSSDYGATWTTNDIIGVALNLDDGEITFYKNGTSQGVAFTDLLTDIDDTGWTPFFASYDGDMSFNFGNGYFGTTAVSSAGTNASGIGIFEYDVPTGYTAISTKGLNL